MINQPPQLAPCPVVVTVNLDVETIDALVAGAAGLFGRYSYGRYGAREGIWRLLNMFEETGVKATFFVSADDARRHGQLIEALLRQGHEIAAQGSVLTEQQRTGPADLDLIAHTHDVLAKLTGTPPMGWRTTNGLMTIEVLNSLASCGFAYDSSFQDDDFPYVFSAGDNARLVELPVCDYFTDATFYAGRHSHQRVRKAWLEEFDATYSAGGYVCLTLHSRGDIGSARTVRVRVVEEFIHHMRSRPGITFYRCDELAERLRQSDRPAEPIPDWPLTAPA